MVLHSHQHPSSDLAQVGPVVDFLQHQRFEWRGPFARGRARQTAAAASRLHHEGRTVPHPGQVAEWQGQLGQERITHRVLGVIPPFNDFRPGGRGARRWATCACGRSLELLTSRHCSTKAGMRHAGTWTEYCIRREASIWSMQVNEPAEVSIAF